MIKLYIRKNPNELADLGFPDGLLPPYALHNFISYICNMIHETNECNLCNLCSKIKDRHVYVEVIDFTSNEFYAGEFMKKKIEKAINEVLDFEEFNIKPYIRME